MNNMEAYFLQYTDSQDNSVLSSTTYGESAVGDNYWEPYPYGTYPQTYVYPYYSVHQDVKENKTEMAFKILKVLVKEQVVMPQDDYYKFVELIEKIAKAI